MSVVMEMEEDEVRLEVGELKEEIHHANHGINLFATDPPLGDVYKGVGRRHEHCGVAIKVVLMLVFWSSL